MDQGMSTQSTEGTQAYTVMARRFRPQSFSDVVGQDHISQALKNAISGNRVAHAYLFTGARGVGKTSTARILAKALNCQQGVDGNPCNECEICQGISAGNDVDVLEIDGASNNGVDDIRQLRANVNVMSMRTQYKVYIIDEVHMLSKGAFNALLKTLEEPPAKVKFIFCTTEPNRIPDTILSRCQRFDFATIETNNIKGRLHEIAKVEGVEVDDDALELVARRAAGSMRDSQSLFDQLLAFGEEHISAGDVHRLLGTATDERLVEIVGSLIQRDQAAALAAFHKSLDDGVQLGELTDQLLFYFRDLMILATGAGAESVELLAVSPASRASLADQADEWGLQTIVAAMQILADTKGRMQRVTYGRALAELALVRVGMLEDLTDIGGLIDQLRSSEPAVDSVQKKNDVKAISISAQEVQELRASVDAPASVARQNAADATPATPNLVPATAETTSASSESSATSCEPIEKPSNPIHATAPAPAPDAAMALESQSTTAVVEDAKVEDAKAIETGQSLLPSHELLPSELDQVVGSIKSASVEAEEVVASTRESVSIKTEAGAPSVIAVDVAENAPKMDNPATEAAPLFAFKPENASAVWSQVVSQINDMLKTHVKVVTNTAIFAPNRLEITFPKRYNFSKQYCEKPDALGRLEKIASSLTGQNVRITLVVSEDLADSVDQQKKAATKEAKKRKYKPEEDTFVANVMEAFGAQCVKVTPLSSQPTTDSADADSNSGTVQ
jgi:DNA polymerase-3 subunit gamma/tau